MGAFVAGAAIAHEITPSAEKEVRGTFAERFEAAEQLRERGITDFQREAYKPGISDMLARGLAPFNYGRNYDAGGHEIWGDFKRVWKAFQDGTLSDQNESTARAYEEGIALSRDASEKRELEYEAELFRSRLDAWRIYLGLPQENRTFGISGFRPARSREDRYYYKINGFLEHVARFEEQVRLNDPPIKYLLRRMTEGGISLPPGQYGRGTARANPGALSVTRMASGSVVAGDIENMIMGKFTLSKGEDARGHYISYYDLWDLDGSLEGKNGVIGKPFMIYDRIYYDPETFQVISPKGEREP